MLEFVNGHPQYGIAIVVVFLTIILLREIFNLKEKKNIERINDFRSALKDIEKKHYDHFDKIEIKICKIKNQLDDLYKMHDKKDEEGVYVWYVRRSLEKAIEKLADNVSKQTVIFQGMFVKIEEMSSSINMLKDK